MNYNKLTSEQERVILHKATEAPFTGEYDNFYEDGTFICRRCNAPLFSSRSKFDARCGWPSFDESFPNAIKHVSDPDGIRTEIQCANCGAHLGHEFLGEGLTDKTCGNVSIHYLYALFQRKRSYQKQYNMKNKNNAEITTLVGGCFWCSEAVFKRLKGIKSVLP
jgi:methionine-R-sulfoxide reductase